MEKEGKGMSEIHCGPAEQQLLGDLLFVFIFYFFLAITIIGGFRAVAWLKGRKS